MSVLNVFIYGLSLLTCSYCTSKYTTVQQHTPPSRVGLLGVLLAVEFMVLTMVRGLGHSYNKEGCPIQYSKFIDNCGRLRGGEEMGWGGVILIKEVAPGMIHVKIIDPGHV